MNFFKVVKLLIALGVLVILFSIESWAYDIRIPQSLQAKGFGDTQERKGPYNRIVGGNPAKLGEIPYVVSLQKRSFFGSRTHYCGGSLVSEFCIVTAAHCVEGRDKDDIVIRIGSNSLRFDPLAREMSPRVMIMHPDYNPVTIQHDIAIIKLKAKIKFDETIDKIKIPTDESVPPVDRHCMVSGWGSTNEGGSVSKTLRFTTVPIITNAKCGELYGKDEIYDTMFCAGNVDDGGTDACQGDSGGPFVCEKQLTGIVSWGIGCARKEFPGVYTNVAKYTNWIESHKCFEPDAYYDKTNNSKDTYFNVLQLLPTWAWPKWRGINATAT